jgi:hypothetical protein
MEETKKPKCLRKDAFGNCIQYDADFKLFSNRSQHRHINKPKKEITGRTIPSSKPSERPIIPKPTPSKPSGPDKPIIPKPTPSKPSGPDKPIIPTPTPFQPADKPNLFPSNPLHPKIKPSSNSFRPSKPISGRTIPKDEPKYTPDITPPTPPPSPTPPSPDKDDKKKKFELRPGTSFRIRKGANKITDEQRRSARLSEASYIHEKDGLEAAQDYLDDNGMSDHRIDPETSSDVGITTVNEKTGDVDVAFRGTDPTNINDLKTDMELLHNKDPKEVEHYNKAREHMKTVIDKYGTPDKLHGHSLGGSTAITMGEEHGVNSSTQDPAMTKDLIGRKLNQSHEVTRTTTDFASSPLGISKNDYKITTVEPLEPSVNPVDSHSLRHITESGPRRADYLEQTAKATMKAGKITGEHVLIDETQKSLENGKSFTEHIKDFSPADVNNDGEFSQRTRTMEKIWKEGGGTLTPDEQDALQERDDLAKTPKPDAPTKSMEEMASADVDTPEKEPEIMEEPDEVPLPPEEKLETSPKQREAFRNKSPEQRQKVIEQKAGDLDTLSKTLDTIAEPHNVVKKSYMNSVKDDVVEGLHPTNVVGGLIAGMVGDEIANVVDPDGKLGVQGDEALRGGLSSIIAEKAVSNLAGQAATKGALTTAGASGAVGLVAGEETRKAVAKALKNAGANKDTQEAVSNMVGGGVGSGTTAVTQKGIEATSKGIGQLAKTSTTTSEATAAGDVELAATTAGEGAEAVTAGGEILGDIALAEELGGGELAAETGGLSVLAAAGIGTVIGGGSYLAGKIGQTKVGKDIGKGVGKATGAIGEGAVETAKGIKTGAEAVGKGVTTAAKDVGKGVSTAAKATVSEAKSVGRGVSRATKKVGRFFRHVF